MAFDDKHDILRGCTKLNFNNGDEKECELDTYVVGWQIEENISIYFNSISYARTSHRTSITLLSLGYLRGT